MNFVVRTIPHNQLLHSYKASSHVIEPPLRRLEARNLNRQAQCIATTVLPQIQQPRPLSRHVLSCLFLVHYIRVCAFLGPVYLYRAIMNPVSPPSSTITLLLPSHRTSSHSRWSGNLYLALEALILTILTPNSTTMEIWNHLMI